MIDESVAKHSSLLSSSSDYTPYKPQKRINLNECIDEFVAEETLSKNDAWYCRDCKEHKCAKKKLDLYALPSICIIHLKRFTQNGYYREKNDAPVDYPINGLDLSQYLKHKKNGNGDCNDNDNDNDNDSDDEYIYDLFAVSIHSGGLGGGHYIAYAKNLDNNKWYDFDDSCVSSINEQDAQTNSGYVLFYHKRNIEKKPIIVTTTDNATDHHKEE